MTKKMNVLCMVSFCATLVAGCSGEGTSAVTGLSNPSKAALDGQGAPSRGVENEGVNGGGVEMNRPASAGARSDADGGGVSDGSGGDASVASDAASDGGTGTGGDAGIPGDASRDPGPPVCTTLTYANFGQAFLEARCNGCHETRPPQLTSQAAVRSELPAIIESIATGFMPKRATLSAQEKAQALEWLNCGAP
jgi:hypothetical protein